MPFEQQHSKAVLHMRMPSVIGQCGHSRGLFAWKEVPNYQLRSAIVHQSAAVAPECCLLQCEKGEQPGLQTVTGLRINVHVHKLVKNKLGPGRWLRVCYRVTDAVKPVLFFAERDLQHPHLEGKSQGYH